MAHWILGWVMVAGTVTFLVLIIMTAWRRK